MSDSEKQSLLVSEGSGSFDATSLSGRMPTSLAVDEKLGALFQPDILLPTQYLATLQRKLRLEPEKKLVLAILEDAVACFQKNLFAQSTRGKALFCETEQWILETDTRWVFSFDHCCAFLGLNSEFVRQGLLKWKSRELAARSRRRVIPLKPKGKRTNRSNCTRPFRPEKLVKAG